MSPMRRYKRALQGVEEDRTSPTFGEIKAFLDRDGLSWDEEYELFDIDRMRKERRVVLKHYLTLKELAARDRVRMSAIRCLLDWDSLNEQTGLVRIPDAKRGRLWVDVREFPYVATPGGRL